MLLASIYIIILYLLFIVAFCILIHWVYFTSAIPFEFEVNNDMKTSKRHYKLQYRWFLLSIVFLKLPFWEFNI